MIASIDGILHGGSRASPLLLSARLVVFQPAAERLQANHRHALRTEFEELTHLVIFKFRRGDCVA